MASPAEDSGSRDFVPHVVAWNLTRRCNLACAHCYIAAGGWHTGADELATAECHRIVDEVLEVNPGVLLILSGGEPLLRDDLEEIAAHASEAGATVVVGSNGTRLTKERVAALRGAGVSGVAVSIDSLDPTYHDRFRHGGGSLRQTLDGVEVLQAARLDFIVQMTLTSGNRSEVASLARWSAESGAVAFNVYFLVQTGRADRMQGLSPEENEEVLRELLQLEMHYQGRMLVRSKCQPQIMRFAHESAAVSSLLNYATRCPCGVHYCRITPEGKLTPCPYMPAVAGDLRELPFAQVWTESPLFGLLRRGELGGRCGRCEYREVCGGCRARAFARDGDFLDEDPACSYEPDGRGGLIRPEADVVYGAATSSPELAWSPEAENRLGRIPSFVRGAVVRRVENFARSRGEVVVTPELLDAVRRELPVDFSRRLPFFARRSP